MTQETLAVELAWNEGLRFEGHTEEGAVTSIDGEGGLSPSPMLLFLEALGSCTGADVVEILRKGRQEPDGLEVEVSGTRREEPPRRYVRLELRVRVRGDVDRGKAERAVELSLEKYCSVFHTLDPELRRNTDVRVEMV